MLARDGAADSPAAAGRDCRAPSPQQQTAQPRGQRAGASRSSALQRAQRNAPRRVLEPKFKETLTRTLASLRAGLQCMWKRQPLPSMLESTASAGIPCPSGWALPHDTGFR